MEELLIRRDLVVNELREQLIVAYERMKKGADRHHKGVSYKVGE